MLSSHGAHNKGFASPVLTCSLDCRLMYRNDCRSLPANAAMGLLHVYVSRLIFEYALILIITVVQISALHGLLPAAQEVCHRRPGLA